MKNSVAIVTGASQGIGRSTALRLARDFSAVVLAARNPKALEEVAAAVQRAGAKPFPLALDLSQIEFCSPPLRRHGSEISDERISIPKSRNEL